MEEEVKKDVLNLYLLQLRRLTITMYEGTTSGETVLAVCKEALIAFEQTAAAAQSRELQDGILYLKSLHELILLYGSGSTTTH